VSRHASGENRWSCRARLVFSGCAPRQTVAAHPKPGRHRCSIAPPIGTPPDVRQASRDPLLVQSGHLATVRDCSVSSGHGSLRRCGSDEQRHTLSSSPTKRKTSQPWPSAFELASCAVCECNNDQSSRSLSSTLRAAVWNLQTVASPGVVETLCRPKRATYSALRAVRQPALRQRSRLSTRQSQTSSRSSSGSKRGLTAGARAKPTDESRPAVELKAWQATLFFE
jgi:hypothetical protein